MPAGSRSVTGSTSRLLHDRVACDPPVPMTYRRCFSGGEGASGSSRRLSCSSWATRRCGCLARRRGSSQSCRELVAGETSTIATAASFSVSAGSFPTQLRAAAFAAALNSSGLPTLVRSRPEDRRFQVLVGPYVSTDEAEHAQRALAAWGLGEVRLVVDDTMRGRPQHAAMFVGGETASDGVVIVAAPGMSSVVFEMPSAPREVEVRRTSATTIDISIGQVMDAGEKNVLHMPEGMLLASELTVAGGPEARHARLVVPDRRSKPSQARRPAGVCGSCLAETAMGGGGPCVARHAKCAGDREAERRPVQGCKAAVRRCEAT